MLKLMKYEFRKQMGSKFIIAIVLGALVVYFAVMNIMGKMQGAGVALVLMFLVMVVATFYVSVESLAVYDKDLKTKQSYMLFLVPQSSYKILGAKIIAAILQICFTMVIYVAAIVLCGTIFLIKYSSVKEILEFVKQYISISFNVNIDAGSIARVLSMLLIFWIFIVMLGIFTQTMMNTILSSGKLTSFLALVAYVVLFWGVLWIESKMYNGFNAGNVSAVIVNVIDYAYFIVVDVALYLVSAWLIEKKLSV